MSLALAQTSESSFLEEPLPSALEAPPAGMEATLGLSMGHPWGGIGVRAEERGGAGAMFRLGL